MRTAKILTTQVLKGYKSKRDQMNLLPCCFLPRDSSKGGMFIAAEASSSHNRGWEHRAATDEGIKGLTEPQLPSGLCFLSERLWDNTPALRTLLSASWAGLLEGGGDHWEGTGSRTRDAVTAWLGIKHLPFLPYPHRSALEQEIAV